MDTNELWWTVKWFCYLCIEPIFLFYAKINQINSLDSIFTNFKFNGHSWNWRNPFLCTVTLAGLLPLLLDLKPFPDDENRNFYIFLSFSVLCSSICTTYSLAWRPHCWVSALTSSGCLAAMWWSPKTGETSASGTALTAQRPSPCSPSRWAFVFFVSVI